jgi:hypothetical protein
MLLGQMMRPGAWDSRTVMVNEQVLTLPALSVAV